MSLIRLAPLAAIAALGLLPIGAVAQGDQPTVVSVGLSEFKLTPPEIVLNKGQHYVLRVTDNGKHGHSFSAKAFFRTVSFEPASAGALHDGEVELASGATTEVAFTPQTAGTYEMHCSHPLHAMLGMSGHIVVR
jgi:uncharacterized cupredoxin-like copper-binding protein